MSIRYLVMDVDGTLTDGKIYIGNSGELCKAFHVKDGAGIHDILIPAGCIPVIITSRQSAIVLNRCRELEITEIHQGVKDKLTKLEEICGKNLGDVAYIGDDINDLPCMKKVTAAGGVIGCPADAVNEVKLSADYIAEHKGGEGAVRDFIDWLVGMQKLITD